MAYNIDNIFSALADENRRNMLLMLSKGSMNVNSIAGHFKISRPAVSKHLKILKGSNLVHVYKEGRNRYISLNPRPMLKVVDWLRFYEKFWNEKLDSLQKFLEK